MVSETEIDTNVVHIEKRTDENRLEMSDEHLDRIREEDENMDGDDRKIDDNDEQTKIISKMNNVYDENVDNENDDQDENKSDEKNDDDDKMKVDDVPLINKSDLVVINVSTSNPLINNDEKRKSIIKETKVDEKQSKNEKIEIELNAPIFDNQTQSLQLKETEIEDKECKEVKTEETIEIKENGEKNVEINGENKENHIENENNKIEDKKSKSKKFSLWSKVWRSTNTNIVNEKETFKSNDTSIEIIDTPDGEKRNGSVETTETIEIAIINGEAPEPKKQNEENLIPTHLFFQVKSPYLKYVFSCGIFVAILLICALIVILFPSTFDIKNITKQFMNLYNNNETTINIVPTVDTNCGQYKGTLDDDNIAIFRGISYAKAPIGQRRWLPAEENNCNKSSLFDAFDAKDFCFQKPVNNLNLSFSEDCLHLNIWIPNWKKKQSEQNVESTNATKNEQLPVIIYLPGDMITGYSSMDIEWLPSGTDMVKQYNSIFITLNYRFGVLGFLSLDLLHKRSKKVLNYGLSDIIMALKWINQNIEFFGGDPEQITLIAHGSSASLALVAATNEDSSQYLTKVWLSAPAPTFANISLKQTFEMNNQFINNVGCQPNLTSNMRIITDLEDQVTDCLLKITPENIVKATPLDWYETFNFLPSNKIEVNKVPILIYDNYFIKSNPYELIDTTNVEIIFGMNVEETGAFSSKPDELESWEDENFAKLIQTQLQSINTNVTDEVINQYINSSDYISNEQIYHRLVTEIRYICPLFKSLENLTNMENIYLYINKYKPSYPIRYTNDHSDSKMTVHGIDVIALLDLLTKWFVINPKENDLNYITTIKNEFKSYVHSMNSSFNFINLSKNEINLFNNDGKLTTQPLPIHNCHRFWSSFNQFAKVN